MNRKVRRAKLSAFKRELKTAIFDELVDITSQEAVTKFSKAKGLGVFQKFYKNSIYSVQTYRRDNALLLGIRRHDEKPSCPWVHKQKIKNMIAGKESQAIEIFPPADELINDANIYWLWVLNEPLKLNLGEIK